MDISELLAKAQQFEQELEAIKAQAKPDMPPGEKPGWPLGDTWYAYRSMGNISFLNSLLTGENRNVFHQIRNRPIADIGAADGDVGFFLGSLGYTVDIIDNPRTNWNNLRGAYTLKRKLASSVDIHEVDLDKQFKLPRDEYGAVILLGILYHLQNPFYAMRQLAERSEYCFLSTRIAQFAGGVDVSNCPVAYLLDPDECNKDATNYWIFTAVGLKRLIERTGWQILDSRSFGCTDGSDVSSQDRDERAFAFLKSRLKQTG